MIHTLIPSPLAAALAAVAFFTGMQTGFQNEPLFELWTLKTDLSADLIAGSTVNRAKIVAALGLSAS